MIKLIFVCYLSQTLMVLNLRWNEIGSLGAKHLADALEKNQVS
jgi:hypothetical protein